MADNKDRQAKQRFVALRVNEVSLVDSPANEREFLVIKRTDAAAQKAKWSAKQINDLPDSAFLHVEDGGKKDDDGKTVPRSLRMFPFKGPSGEVDLPHLRNALARIPDSNLSADLKKELTAKGEKLLAAADKESKKMSTKTDAEKTAEMEAAEKAKKGKGEADQATLSGQSAPEGSTGSKPGVQPLDADEKAAAAKSTAEATKKAADDLAAAEKAVKDATDALEAMKAKAPPFKKKPGNAAEDAKDGGADDAEETEDKKKSMTTTVQKDMDPKGMIIQMMCDDLHSRLYKLQNLAALDTDSLVSMAKSLGVEADKLAEIEKVAKGGKKQLSTERMEKFNASLKGLMEIAKDADPAKLQQTLKDMLATLSGGAALETGGENSPKPPPQTTTQVDGNGYAATSAVKAAEAKVTKAQADLEDLKKQVEKLQGAQAVSKALTEETTETTTQKGKKSLWKGII